MKSAGSIASWTVGLSSICLLFNARFVAGSINFYNQELLSDNFLLYRKSAMITPDDWEGVSREHGAEEPAVRSDIEVELDFIFSAQSTNHQVSGGSGLVQVSVIPPGEFEYLGAESEENARAFCCSDELAAKGDLCDAPGRLIFDSKASRTKTWDVVASQAPRGVSETVTRLKASFPVETSGYHYVVISYCSGASGSVKVNGMTRWINPYGFLPAEVVGWLPFWSYLSMAHLLLAAAWAWMCFRFNGPLGPIQQWSTVLLALGALDSYLRYMDYYHFNVAGSRSTSLMLSAGFFLCLKRAISRMVMLGISLGCLRCGESDRTKNSLFDAGSKVSIFGSVYLVASAVQLVAENLEATPSLVTSFFLQFPLVVLDFLVCATVFGGLNTRIVALRKQIGSTARCGSPPKSLAGKYQQLVWYSRLRFLWCFFAAVAMLWGLVFSYGVVHDWADLYWQSFYKLGAFYELESFALFAILAVTLWAPGGEEGMRHQHVGRVSSISSSTSSNKVAYLELSTSAKGQV